MFRNSNRWKLVAAIGQGVLAAMALTGAVKIVGELLGTPLPESISGSFFLLTSMLAGSLSVYLFSRHLKQAEPADSVEARSQL